MHQPHVGAGVGAGVGRAGVGAGVAGHAAGSTMFWLSVHGLVKMAPASWQPSSTGHQRHWPVAPPLEVHPTQLPNGLHADCKVVPRRLRVCCCSLLGGGARG
jgi:hypothetical protein